MSQDGGLATHGFLSTEVAGVVEVVQRRYDQWLKLLRSVNERAVSAQHEASIRREFLPHLIAATAYCRTLTTIQAAVLLLERGLEIQARILLRASLESLFKLKGIERDVNIANAIVAGDDAFRQSLLRKFKRMDKPELQSELEQIEETLAQSELAAKFKEWGVTRLSVEQLAEKADLMPLYLTAYPMLSDSVHAGVRDLERHLETDDNGTVTAIKNEPHIDDLGILFAMAVEFLVLALDGFAAIFELDVESFCEVSRARLKELVAIAADPSLQATE